MIRRAPGRTRTYDRVIKSHLLYQLSYRGRLDEEAIKKHLDQRGGKDNSLLHRPYLQKTGPLKSKSETDRCSFLRSWPQ